MPVHVLAHSLIQWGPVAYAGFWERERVREREWEWEWSLEEHGHVMIEKSLKEKFNLKLRWF